MDAQKLFGLIAKANRTKTKVSQVGSNRECGCKDATLIFFSVLTFNTISILEIVIGAIYIDECPLEDTIPLYLIGTIN